MWNADAEPHDHGSTPRSAGLRWPLTWADVGRLGAWFGVMVVVYVVLGEAIESSDSVVSLDRDVAEAFVDSRSDTLTDLSPWAAGLSDTLVKVVATAIVAAIMLWVWRRWLEPLVVVVALVLEASVFMAATTIVSRPRPAVERLQESPVDSSFPSGHVAAAAAYAAIALVLSWHLRRRVARATVWAAPFVVTGLVAWARLYQGMHYLSDVLLGAVLGVWSVAVAAIVVTRAHVRKPQVDAPSAHRNGGEHMHVAGGCGDGVPARVRRAFRPASNRAVPGP